MTTIINLHGGPGTGKSTSAARIFHLLKDSGENAEMAWEYVKEWAWEGRMPDKYDQLHLLGQQIKRESRLFGKVDWVVSDSPVLLGIHYARKYATPAIARGVEAAILSFYEQAALDGHEHVHVFLTRTKPYNPKGRFQDEAGAREIDNSVAEMLEEFNVDYDVCPTDDASLSLLVETLKMRNKRA